MNSRARYLLRSIALGLPIVGASALAGCASTRNCDPEPVSQRFEVTAAQLASLEDCPALCEELQLASGRPDTGPLAVTADNTCDPVMDDGGLSIECEFVPYCLGRPPAGLLPPKLATNLDTLGAYLAGAAHLERASVPAFFDLRDELLRHGAPPAMASLAVRAARDEVRHADAIAALARSLGAEEPAIERTETGLRTMRDMAHDNATVGCVGEAHAALVAAHQAAHAPTDSLRRVYAGIARDEAQHALLSFAIHDWAMATLPSRHAKQLEESRREAHEALLRGVATDSEPLLARALGLPTAERAVALAETLA